MGRRLSTYIAAAFLTALVMAIGDRAEAQTGPAFTCSGDIYQVQSGQLRIFDPITSTYLNVGPNNSNYNATGYNLLDNYAYASQGRNVIRVSSNGVIETLFDVGFGSFSGDVDRSNNYWLRRNNNTYARINLITQSSTDVTFTGVNGGPADVAYIQSGGEEFLVGFSGGSAYSYNITNQTKSLIAVDGLPGGAFGAAWTDFNGRIFTFRNSTGILYEIFDLFSGSARAVQVGIGDPSNSNDGFSCSEAPFPNLAPLAFDDDFTTPVNQQLSGNVLADNGNGADNDPEGGPVTVNTTPTTGPSNGSVVLAADGSFTYTPAPNFFGVDTFTYEITDQTGLTALATVTIVVEANPSFTVTKTQVSGPDPVTSLPATLSYEIEVENTGDVRLTGIAPVDTLPNGTTVLLTGQSETGAAVNVPGELDVGETWTYTTAYTVTQDDMDDGSALVNSVSATSDQTGTTTETDNASTSITQSPSFDVVKTSDTPVLTSPGLITYEITVANTGNTTITGLAPTDTLTQGGAPLTLASGLVLSGDTNTDGRLDLTETWVYTTTFSATQVQIDNGGDIVNAVSIDSDNGGTETSQTTTTISFAPAYTVDKTVDVSDLSSPGSLNYTIVVENTGNMALTGVVLTDTLTQGGALAYGTGPTLSGDANSNSILDVGEVWTYIARFDASQAEIDNGGDIVNTASIASNETGPVADSVTTTVTQTDDLTLAKAVASGEPTSFSTIGDTIDFLFTVTNTGNTTRTGPITIDDDQIGTGLACLAGNLAPGASGSCTITWTADQSDLDAGSVTNIATATDNSGETTDPAMATVTAVQNPALSLTKTIVDPKPTVFAAGETLLYEYLVVNTGNVTLPNPITVDDNLTTVVCPAIPAGGLVPQGSDPVGAQNSIVCTASYLLTTVDETVGSTTNVATASTTVNGTTVVDSASDSATFPVSATPVIELQKSAPAGLSVAAVGDIITYTFDIRNVPPAPPAVGAVLTETIFINDNKFASPIVCYDPAVEGGSFAPGDTHSCTEDYVVTQDDLDAGEVVNEATANSLFAPSGPGIDIVSNIDTVTVPVDTAPELTVAKSVASGANPASAGDVIDYQIVATNTGNQTLNTVAISDPGLGTLTCDIAAPVTLDPADALTCTGSYTVTQSDIDGQTVGDTATAIYSNTATATANDPSGTAITPGEDSVDHPLTPAAPAVTIVKELFPDPAASPAFEEDGDLVRYRIRVSNSGNMTLTTTAVTDTLVPGTCSVGPLAPGETDATCIFDYMVDQDDVDAGQVTNIANATAQPIDSSSSEVTDTDTLISNGPNAAGALEVIKAGTLDLGADGVATVGDVIDYTITVSNVGNVTLRDIAVTDPGADVISYTAANDPDADNDINVLLPGASTTVTAQRTLTQPDIDAGVFSNTATATGLDPNGTSVTDQSDSSDSASGSGPNDPTVTLIPRITGLNIDKTASTPTGTGAGDTVTYSYLVQNTGNVTLTGITLSDAHTSSSGTVSLAVSGGGSIASLDPGASVTLSASYVLTQADIDAGNPITNVATVNGNGPTGTTPPSAMDTESVTPEAVNPSLEVLKTVRSRSGSAAGATIVFEVTVENDGNVTLTTPSVSDTLRRIDNTLVVPSPTPIYESGDVGVIGQLNVGETWVYRVTHVLTQSDIDAGGISNSVFAISSAPDGSPVSDTSDNGAGGGSDPTTVAIPAAPSIEAVKTITSSTVAEGETVTFEITVENTGNVTLSGVQIASDTLTRADGTVLALTTPPTFLSADAGSLEATLQVGETATYRATYVLQQTDIDAGGIENTATAQGNPPSGPSVSDVSDDTGAGSDPTVLDIPASPSIAFEKRLASGGPSYEAVDDVLSYEFEITNTGNVTLIAPFDVADPLITDAGGSVVCPTANLAPAASHVCTGSYAVTQDDLDDGGVDNTATATVGAAPPVSDSVSVPARQLPEMTLSKVADPIAAVDFVVGATVSYTFTVTNSGNITITDPITIDDPLIAPADITCPTFPAAGIAPGADYVCTGELSVTSGDVQVASITNNATATDGTTTSPTATETVPSSGTPALDISKALVGSNQPDGSDSGTLTFDEVGDQLAYEFTVTNSGTVSYARDVDVIDTRFTDPISCFVPDAANPDLTPGESVVCTAIYTVDQDDLDAGEVLNEAFARTLFGATETVVQSPPADVTTPADASPSLTIEKSADRADFAALNEAVEFTFRVTNDGNQTLTNVFVSDALLPSLTCEASTLAVGDTLDCTAFYVITQADIDRGSMTNTAFADGFDPAGDAVAQQSDSVTLGGPSVAPTLALRKTATPDQFNGVGTAVTYGFEVTNTSIYTLSAIEVSDSLFNGLPPFSCSVGTLAPGAVDTSCQISVVVTQEMVDAGSVTNTASVVGEDPFGNPATDTDTITTNGPTEDPAIEATKTILVPATTVNTVITYTLTLGNPGNVSIDGITVDDVMQRANGDPIALDAPFALVGGDANGDGALNPTETWTYEAPYTITQDDINQGGFSNVATVNGTSPSDTPVSDVADDGNDTDGNTEDDPTEVEITTDPVLDVEKVLTVAGTTTTDPSGATVFVPAGLGDEIVFEITATNRGNVDVFNAVPLDVMTRADGADISADITGPTRLSNSTDAGDGTLSPGEFWLWEVRYTLTQDDIDAGGLSNIATVTGEDIGGAPVTDVSDNGNDTDGNTVDDPTVLNITPEPDLDVVKTVTTVGSAAGDEVVFDITVTNTGNVTLTNLVLLDTMTNVDGDPVSPVTIDNSAVPTSLGVGASTSYEVRYVLTQADVDVGGVTNTATVSATTPLGGDVSDVSDDGDDTDGNTDDDTTVAVVEPEPSLLPTKSASIPNRIAPNLFEVTFTMTAENTGNVTLTNLEMQDNLIPFVEPAELVTVGSPAASGFTVGVASASYDGVADINLLEDAASLAPGATGSVILTVTFSTENGLPDGINTLVVASDQLPDQAVATASIAAASNPDVFVTKSVTPTDAVLGDTVTYTMTFENRVATTESNLSLIDALPPGVVYTPGTAALDGGPSEPEIDGRSLVWEPITLAPSQTINVTFDARIGSASSGEIINQAYVLDSSGTVVSNVATAVISQRPEAVFECTDIIGKVFDDRNQNGYQDGIEEDRAAITVQDYFSDKFERPEGPEGEPGLPGVRLSTVNGTLITTDEFGRFSVPCAELPADIGSNFQLKLDARTLPTGYHITTENPRNIRVTPGRIARLNFGATLSTLVEIDLTSAAFVGVSPGPALAGWLPVLVNRIDDKPSVLRLKYYRGLESMADANARLDALEAQLRALWRQDRRYRLLIERVIQRVQ